MRALFFLLFLLTTPALVNAACTSPAATTGNFQWFPAESQYKFCDGTYWHKFTTASGPGCGANSGKLDFQSNKVRYCDGTNWQEITAGPSIGSCTGESGKIVWDTGLGSLKACDGTDWHDVDGGLTAPMYISQSVGGSVSSTQCRTTNPSNLKAGDLILTIFYQNIGNGGVTTPSGYTLIGTEVLLPGSAYYLYKHYKVADSTDVAAGNITFTRAGGVGDCGLMAVVFRGVNSVTPIGGYDLNVQASGSTLTFNTLTPTFNNSYSVMIGESMSSIPSNPTGHTSVAAFTAQYTRVSGLLVPTASAVGPKTATTGSSAQWLATHIILNPQ